AAAVVRRSVEHPVNALHQGGMRVNAVPAVQAETEENAVLASIFIQFEGRAASAAATYIRRAVEHTVAAFRQPRPRIPAIATGISEAVQDFIAAPVQVQSEHAAEMVSATTAGDPIEDSVSSLYQAARRPASTAQ